MRLLIMDFIRRNKGGYLIAGLLLSAFRLFTNQLFSGWEVGICTGLMFGAYCVAPREVLFLPLSRKEIWRARWLMWVVVPVILLSAARLPALGIAMTIPPKAWFSPSWLLLSSTYQLAFAGTLLTANIPVSAWLQKLESPLKAFFIKSVFTLAATGLMFIPAYELSAQWRQLTGGTILLLAIGCCLTAISFFHSPKIAPRATFPLALGRSSHSGKPELKTVYLRTGRSGLNLLVWRQILTSLVAGVMCGIGSHLHLFILALDPTLRQSLIERGGSIFFAPDLRFAALPFLTPVVLTALWTSFAPDWLRVRHLRALPLTTQTLAAMFTLLPTMFWLTYWVSPLATYWLLTGHLPSTFRLDFLAGITGLTCLLCSASMQVPVKAPGKFLVLHILSCAGFIAISINAQPVSSTMTLLIGVFGLIGGAVSFLLNVRAFRRNSSVYTSLIPRFAPAPKRWIAQ